MKTKTLEATRVVLPLGPPPGKNAAEQAIKRSKKHGRGRTWESILGGREKSLSTLRQD